MAAISNLYKSTVWNIEVALQEYSNKKINPEVFREFSSLIIKELEKYHINAFGSIGKIDEECAAIIAQVFYHNKIISDYALENNIEERSVADMIDIVNPQIDKFKVNSKIYSMIDIVTGKIDSEIAKNNSKSSAKDGYVESLQLAEKMFEHYILFNNREYETFGNFKEVLFDAFEGTADFLESAYSGIPKDKYTTYASGYREGIDSYLEIIRNFEI